MGCCEALSLVYLIYPKVKMCKRHFQTLSLLDSEVSQLLLVFKRISSKHKDHEFVEVANVMKFFNVGENKFMNKAFRSLCKKNITYVNFSEFVMLVWFFCTIGNNLALFVFSVYDTDGNGLLDAKEGNIMNQEIYGKYYASSRDGQRLNGKMQELGRDGVAKLFFKEFCKGHPELLKPAEDNINLIKRYTLGHRRWLRMQEYRKALTRDKFTDILTFVKLVQDKCRDMEDLYGVEKRIKRKAILKRQSSGSKRSFASDEVQSFREIDDGKSTESSIEKSDEKGKKAGKEKSDSKVISKPSRSKKGGKGAAEVLPIQDFE